MEHTPPTSPEVPMHATLPENLEPATLETMQTGETAWTTPWGMWVDTDRRCWLHPQYPAMAGPRGTASMRVTLTDRGYEVTVPDGATWQPQERATYVGDVPEFLPVARLVHA